MTNLLGEFFGTMILITFGAGVVACVLLKDSKGNGGGWIVITAGWAFAVMIGVFTSVALGAPQADLNPAVTLAKTMLGTYGVAQAIATMLSQVAGAFAGSGLLMLITKETAADGLGSNGYGELSSVGISMTGAIIVEIVLTFVFVLTVLGVTSSEKYSSVAGIVIGLTLTFVHIIGIPLTGTSVNPARSLAPAVLDGGIALNQVWVFLVAPLAGAALAGIIFKFLFKPKEI